MMNYITLFDRHLGGDSLDIFVGASPKGIDKLSCSTCQDAQDITTYAFAEYVGHTNNPRRQSFNPMLVEVEQF